MLRKAINGLGVFLLFVGLPGFAIAEPLASPSLTARIGGVENDAVKQPELKITDLDVKMRLDGLLAEVTITAQFANPSKSDVEGEFALALPAGAIVTGYALDIDGVMVDGVLANQSKARKTYEDRVRAGIDPGVAEVTRDNRFKTRIFPIRAGKGRTIRLHMILPIDANGRFSLPLFSKQLVGQMHISAEAMGVSAKPRLLLPAGIDFDWSGGKGGYRGEATARDVSLNGELGMEGGRVDADAFLSVTAQGDRFVQISGGSENSAAAATKSPKRIRVYWDSSRSHDPDAAKLEAKLVRKIAEMEGGGIDLITFASGKPYVQKLPDVAALDTALAAISYRGATSLMGVDALPLDPAGLCLFAGDGSITIDKQAAFEPDCVVHVISAQRSADAARLGRIAARGQWVKLDANSEINTLASQLSKAQRSVASVRDGRGRALPYRMLFNNGSRYALVAKLPGDAADDVVKVTTTGGGAASSVQDFAFADKAAAKSELAGQYWAADRIAALSDNPAATEELENLSRRHSIASPLMSFVVFELPEDYVEIDVAPPASYPAAKRAEYDELHARAVAEKASARKQRVEYVQSQWEERKKWWATKFNPNAGPSKDNRNRDEVYEVMPAPPPPPSPIMPSPDAAPAAAVESERLEDKAADVVDAAADAADVIVAANKSQPRPGQTFGEPEPDTGKIEVETVFADRPYLDALNKTKPANRLTVLTAQEREYGTAPAFYLDTALWFATKGDKATAIDLLLSALELSSSNAETELIVANRLLRWGEMDRAVEIFSWLEAQTEGRPQPARSLALALAARADKRTDARAAADLEKAIQLLERVALEPANSDYDGIELVALMEANALVPRLESAGRKSPLAKELTALLDLDTRIVIEWTNDDADIDLWVDEPNGERAIYSNPRTAIGGMVSNDMTDGFGPEEYVLRRAPRGKFIVRTNSYSGDVLNPNGASRIIVRLYRNFGRPNETMELLDVELSEKDGEENRMIATISARE